MKLTTHYLTYIEFPDEGIGVCDPKDFDGAVDAYDESMGWGYAATVFRVEPGENGEAGMMIDVTDDAIACVAKRCRLSDHYMPQWLVEAMQ